VEGEERQGGDGVGLGEGRAHGPIVEDGDSEAEIAVNGAGERESLHVRPLMVPQIEHQKEGKKKELAEGGPGKG